MDSPFKQTWKRFKKDKMALAGLVFIALMVLVSLLGYLITPDQSPQANTMILQLSIKKPGSTFTLLKIPVETTPVKVNIFKKMLFGQPSFYHYVPITGYRFSHDSLIVIEYIGDEELPESKSYPLRLFLKKVKANSFDVKEKQAYIINRNIEKRIFWFGTDIYGRDLLSRLILGVRISFSVGIIAVIISLTIGVFLGSIAGYYGGKIDLLISWFMNVVWSLPTLLLVIAISFALGKGFWQIFVAVGISIWVDAARLVRGQMVSFKHAEFAEAAKALGFKDSHIIIYHILPNITGPILVIASANFASAILLEAGLSFLGFGAQPPVPAWGGMIKEHYGYIIMDAAYLAVLPGLAIMIMVYAFNLVAAGLRDAYDVKS